MRTLPSLIAILLTVCSLTAKADFYVANYGSNSVSKITSDGTVSTFVTGIAYPRGIVVDASGNVYVASETGYINKYSSDGTLLGFAYGVGSNDVEGIALGSDGSVYASAGLNIKKASNFSMDGADVSLFASGGLGQPISSPQGLAFDSSGNLYAANWQAGTIAKITPGGSASVFASGFLGPIGLVFDAAGNLYAANSDGGSISKITPDGTASIFFSNATAEWPYAGLSAPQGIAFDAAGNLYVACPGGGVNNIVEIPPSGTTSTEFVSSGLSSPTYIASTVPEPGAIALFGLGSAALAWIARSRNRRAS